MAWPDVRRPCHSDVVSVAFPFRWVRSRPSPHGVTVLDAPESLTRFGEGVTASGNGIERTNRNGSATETTGTIGHAFSDRPTTRTNSPTKTREDHFFAFVAPVASARRDALRCPRRVPPCSCRGLLLLFRSNGVPQKQVLRSLRSHQDDAVVVLRSLRSHQDDAVGFLRSLRSRQDDAG
jgi:hypothetical protein